MYKSRVHPAATNNTNTAEARTPEPVACSVCDSEATRSCVGVEFHSDLGEVVVMLSGEGGCSAVRTCAGQLGSATELNHEWGSVPINRRRFTPTSGDRR